MIKIKQVSNKIDENRLGLTLGIFLAGLHALWSFIIAIGSGQSLLDNATSLHFLDISYQLLEFSFTKAILLILMTFISGYIGGWVLAYLWNWVGSK